MITQEKDGKTYNLSRFITAQEHVYDQVRKELTAGCKTSHWMWFIFPQIKGLGRSSTAIYYSIQSLDEAKAYLEHPVLGQRLTTCCQLLLQLKNKSAKTIFGHIDSVKLKSSMTLFISASKNPIFSEVLQQYFDGKEDFMTNKILLQSENSINKT